MSNRQDILWRLPEATLSEVQRYVAETRSLGLERRSGRITVNGAPGPLNVQANNNAGDRVGETQAEVAVAVFGDTVVVGFNDSRGFTVGASPGVGTLSGFAYSTNGGASFTDGGTTPVALATDFCFGDPGIDTDERGNWYYNQIYTRAGPQQDIGVHHGRFNGAGVLVWDLPVMAAIGTGATGNLDKCLLACDRVTGNVYTSYTRFTATPQIEIARSTTLGATWDPPIVLDAGVTPTSSKQAARPFCGPNGEVYVVWEKGSNFIFCPDGSGNIVNGQAQIAFTRSMPPNYGALGTYDPFTIIGNPFHTWEWSGPGDLRERGNEFPDIAVDRSGLGKNGRIYVTWHESASWTANFSAGPPVAEAADAANNNPGGAELFTIGDDVTGSISSNADLDYWTFSATQGQTLLFILDPQGFVCGVSGTSRGMRMRLFAVTTPFPNPTGFPDSLLAASAQGTFEDRIQWTCPMTGSYLVRLQRSSGTAPFTYTLRARNLTYGGADPSRDARDAVVVYSSNDGVTWTSPQRVNDDPAGLENRRPFVSVDGLGHAHIFWHDSRKAGLGSTASLTTIYGTTSRDGGVTWNPNFPVTDEPSFFSFNTIAVPNLGDYNMSASSGAVTHPAWSDQRISTGDVRTPATNTYTAGRGPETYSTRVIYDFSIACPPDQKLNSKSTASLVYTITNTGTVPDRYGYTVTDGAGWASGSGTTGTVAPGASTQIKVFATSSPDCAGAPDTVTFAVTAVGDQDGTQKCSTILTCSPQQISKTLESDRNPSFCGEKVIFTARLSQADASGEVNFFDGNDPIGSSPVVAGVASLSISTLGVGTHSITAVYKGDGGHLPVTSNKIDQVVNEVPTTTTLESEPNPSGCGQDVVFVATISPAPGGGTVNFFNNGNKPLGSAPVSGGTATITISTLAIGSHSITAVFKGFGCYAASTSNKVEQVVGQNPTAVALSSSMNPSSCGVKLTLRAKVQEPQPPGLAFASAGNRLLAPPPPTGTVNFFDGGNPIGSATLVDSVATLSITNFTVGTHSITATYKGDTCYASSTSDKLTQIVDPSQTSTTLASSPNPSSCGEKVTITAMVNPAAATGTVSFFDNLAPIGTVMVVNGVATLSISTLTVGNHSLIAEYSGDTCYASSLSNKVVQVVNPATTTTTLTTDPNPSVCGQKVTLTAKVDPPTATGEVNFFDAGAPIGSGTLVNGTATLSITTLAVGTHSLTAGYKGDNCYRPSESNKVDQVVNRAPTTTTLTGEPNPSVCRQKVTLRAKVDPPTATGTVNFSGDVSGSAPLVNGEATLSVVLGTGTHSFFATYKGDDCYAPSQSTKLVQVTTPAPTTTTLTSSPNPSLCDQKVTLTARVDPATATGTVNFFDSTAAIGSATLVNGSASVSLTTLAHGIHSFTAVYKGDSCYASSTSDKAVHFHDCPVATLLSLFLAEPKSGAIELRWQFDDPSRFVETRIERGGSVDGPWAVVAAELRDEAGVRVAVDRTVESGKSYWYRLVARPEFGAPLVFGPLAATAGSTIQRFELAGIWPNPSKNLTRIDFAVARESNIRLSVMDLQGREMVVLAEGSHRPGRYQAVWTGETPRGLAPIGMYFVRYQVPGKVMMGRLVLAR